MILLLASYPGLAQNDSTKLQIQVLARTSPDSIVLRWAPTNPSAWISTIQNGYTIERYTLVRDGDLVRPPEKKELVDILKPWPEEEWEQLVNGDKYAAIAAQSLYGSDFELAIDVTNVFQIVSKVQENQMRYSFALYAADLSRPVSIAMGLRFTDHEVKENEKYLYRIWSIHENDTIVGSAFVKPEFYELPIPLEFTADFKGNMVSLKWDQSYHRGIYTAYIVERSEDGKVFKPISEEALVTLSNDDKPESKYQYATDSLPSTPIEFSYRVKGLTPFGEVGPPTEPISGGSSIVINEVPYIRSSDSPDNKVINLNWEFPPESEPGLKGFEIRRMTSPKSMQVTLNKNLIAPASRTYQDISPQKNNYYQVIGISLSGEEFKSPVHLSQLIDSIPPGIPLGLVGKVDENGKVSFSWKPNEDDDIYGYRIYRGNNLNAEFSQITIEPINETEYADSISLKTLDKFIYYQVMAIDKSQNHSGLSKLLALELPDQVPPVSPVFLPFVADKNRVNLQWLPSSSDDVVNYAVYGQKQNALEWERIGVIPHSEDSIMTFSVSGLTEGEKMNFTVVAIDRSGLESPPAAPITASKLVSAVKPPVKISQPVVDRQAKKIQLSWTYEEGVVNKYQVYRSRQGEENKLYATIDGSAKDFVDTRLEMNTIYFYQVIATFSSGAKSAFGEKIKVNY